MSMKNSDDIIWNGTNEIPACSLANVVKNLQEIETVKALIFLRT